MLFLFPKLVPMNIKLTPEEVQKLINLDKISARRFDPNEHEEF